MANYRQIHVKMWKDTWFLDLSPPHKLLFIYLFSNERACLTGLYDLSERVMVFETGITAEEVRLGLALFAKANKAFYRDGWVWIPNLVRYNAGNIASTKVRTHIEGLIADTPNSALKQQWIAYFNTVICPQYGIHTLSIPYPNSVDTVSIPPPTEHEHEQQQEQEQEQEHELTNAFNLYEQAAGTLSPLVSDRIAALIDDSEKHRLTLGNGVPGSDLNGDAWVQNAILAARDAGAQRISPNYLDAVLIRWRAEGYKSQRQSHHNPTTITSTMAMLDEMERQAEAQEASNV